jgi:hypothetical protein
MSQQATGGTRRTNVVVDPDSVQKIVHAIEGLTDIIAGRSGGDLREPTVEQARTILDFELLSQVLGRPGRTVTVVRATRDGSLITFRDPLPDEVTKVAVTPRRGRVEVVSIDRHKGEATLVATPDSEPLGRVELQTAAGFPVAFCPRLPASSSGGID